MNARAPFLAAACLLAAASSAFAAPFTINTVLSGDNRPGSPDGLTAVVTISGDTTSTITNWLVDLNMPAHPDAALDGFYFNLTGNASDYTLSNFNPATWSMTGTNA